MPNRDRRNVRGIRELGIMAQSTATAAEDIGSVQPESSSITEQPKKNQDQVQIQDPIPSQPTKDQDQAQVQDPAPSQEELLAHVRAQPGTALVKEEYIDFSKVSERFIERHRRSSAPKDQQPKKPRETEGAPSDGGSEPPTKKQKVRGQNKRRPRDKRMQPGDRPCLDFLKSATCRFGDNCRFSHDIKKLVEGKPPDIGPTCILFENYGRCPFGVLCRFGSGHVDANLQSIVDEEKVKETGGQPTVLNGLPKDLQIKLRKKSFNFKKYDEYMKIPKNKRIPVKSQDAPAHVNRDPQNFPESKKVSKDVDDSKTVTGGSSCLNGQGRSVDAKTDCSSIEGAPSSRGADANGSAVKEDITPSARVPCNAPTNVSGTTEESSWNKESEVVERTSSVSDLEKQDAQSVPLSEPRKEGLPLATAATATKATGNHGDAVAMVTSDAYHAGSITDEDVIKTRITEKKKLDVDGKLLLAPLTTVGNLPFRAVCKKLGADITCGEMAMCTNLLQGQMSEWALLKRHPSEDVFGVQLCGAFPDTMTKCAELLNEMIDIDFVDVNVGCPIDLVYHKGAGTGLMNRMGKFQEIVRGMSSVLDIPLTVKMRTGLHEGTLTAHKIIPRIYDWGASVVTVHGRTREQRYTKLADWSYLGDCARAAHPHSFIGNGDILSYEDANFFREQSGVDGLMIARGALIKPWVFTEIKEQRHWDISSRERLDVLQDYVNYGLMHWGSDNEGVQKTRRFLLEWLSFLHRYIPAGVLERLPQRINERPPYFVGRDDLETLMASANCADWLKISEMFLGPAPDDFDFLPKHKANSYK